MKQEINDRKQTKQAGQAMQKLRQEIPTDLINIINKFSDFITGIELEINITTTLFENSITKFSYFK